MMPVMDGQSGIHLAGNVQVQFGGLAFQIWFVSVISCRGVELV